MVAVECHLGCRLNLALPMDRGRMEQDAQRTHDHCDGGNDGPGDDHNTRDFVCNWTHGAGLRTERSLPFVDGHAFLSMFHCRLLL